MVRRAHESNFPARATRQQNDGRRKRTGYFPPSQSRRERGRRRKRRRRRRRRNKLEVTRRRGHDRSRLNRRSHLTRVVVKSKAHNSIFNWMPKLEKSCHLFFVCCCLSALQNKTPFCAQQRESKRASTHGKTDTSARVSIAV